FGFQRQPVSRALFASALAPFLPRFSLWRRQGRPPLLQRRSVLQSGPHHAGCDRRLLQARRRGRLLLRLALQTWLLRKSRLRRTRPLRRGILFLLRHDVLFLKARLTRRIGGGIVSGGVSLALDAPLGDDLAADILRGVNLAHDALVAQRLLRRDRERHRGKASPGAEPDRKAAGALRQSTEPRAVVTVDLDPPAPPVGIGIELDRDIVRACGGSVFWPLDQTGGAANAQRRGRRRDP